MNLQHWKILLASSLFLLAACACSSSGIPEGPSSTALPATSTLDGISSSPARIEPTVSSLPPSNTPVVIETLTSTPLPVGSVYSTNVQPTAIPSASPAVIHCEGDICTYTGVFFLERPIKPPDNDVVDATYRFGTTQGGKREAHHGVEMLNGFGTPVYAAGDGMVVVAGEDRDPISPQGEWPILYYGPFSYFYGNLVVIEHEVPEALWEAVGGYPPKVYSLYAHLSEILVAKGQQVRAGQEIGRVGITGVSMGSHLHFEVRVGENTYQSSRNPELWLEPHSSKRGELNGGLAVRVLDSYGVVQAVSSVVLEYLPDGPEQPADFEVYLQSYEEKALLDQPPWQESFAVGDLPAGLYRVSFPYFGRQELLVEVLPNQLTLLTFQAK